MICSDKFETGPMTMPKVWRAAKKTPRAEFENLCANYLDCKGKRSQPKRLGDKKVSISYSPLDLKLIPMTIAGMKMLDRVWTNTGCRVWPHYCRQREGPELVEVMPGQI